MTVAQVQTVAFLSLFVFAESADAIPIQQLSTIDWVREISIMTFELTIFARVYFKELLAERNKVIAKIILDKYEETPNSLYKKENCIDCKDLEEIADPNGHNPYCLTTLTYKYNIRNMRANSMKITLIEENDERNNYRFIMFH